MKRHATDGTTSRRKSASIAATSMSGRIAATALLCCAGLMLSGYTFYEIDTDVGSIPLRWYTATIAVFYDSALTPDAPADATLDAIDASIDAWDMVDCAHPLLVNSGALTGTDAIVDNDSGSGRHGNNLVIFENAAAWTENRGGSTEWDTSLTVALTTIFHVPTTGEIRNFALELNDDAFTFGIEPTGYAFDIQNTVTHELGHVIGLDHTDSSVSDFAQQTMYFEAEPGEILKRTPEVDDRTGLCMLYSTDWNGDLDDGDGGCSAGTRNTNPWTVFPVVFGLVFLAMVSIINRFRRPVAAGRTHERGLNR